MAGSVFAGAQGGNRTPTGSEDPGVIATPECATPAGVYQDLAGLDGVEGTLDDDFTLLGPGAQGPPSPAIDRGLDPRVLDLPAEADPLLLADYLAEDVRPIQRDVNRMEDFDIGALELPCACAEECESCQIVINRDGSSNNRCRLDYDPATQCCNRLNGSVSEKHRGEAYDVCPDTRSAVPGFDPLASADGCSGVPDRPLAPCPAVRFGCDEDSGEENCPEGINLPCNRHDFCYQTCGDEKGFCDDRFYTDMLAVCNAMTPAQKVLCYDDCVIAASTYYSGVALAPAADDAYRNGQNRSCQCCQDMFVSEDEP